MRRHTKHRLRLRSLFLWHRYLGLLAAPWLFVLALTGLALNHTGRFDFAHRYVVAESLLHWYGIKTPAPPVSYAVAGHWVTQLGDRLYLDRAPLPAAGHLIGAVAVGDMIAVGQPDQILLLTPHGELVERLGRAAGLPADIDALGLTTTGILAARASGATYTSDAVLLVWTRTNTSAAWVAPQAAPATVTQDLMHTYRGTGLTWERLLLDLHSGRLLGSWGVYVIDGVTGLLVILATTGLWHWARRRN